MKILHTHHDYNDWSGSRILKFISEELVRRGHVVRVLTGGRERVTETINGVIVDLFPISGNLVSGIRGKREYIQEYDDIILASGADVMLNYAVQSWATDLVFPLLPRISAKKALVPCGYSRLGDKHYESYFSKLPDYLKQYDHIIYLSHNYQDKKFGDEKEIHKYVNFSVIPNAADEREFDLRISGVPRLNFRKKYGINTPYMILAVGNHYLAKNHSLLLKVVAGIKRKDITFALVGRPTRPKWRGCYLLCNGASRFIKNLRLFDSLSREDAVAAFRAADIFLHNSKVECDPIVMYEAFASRTPIVATPVGSIPEFEEYLNIANKSGEIIQRVSFLLDNPKERFLLTGRAYRLWREKYTLARIVDRHEELYNELASNRL